MLRKSTDKMFVISRVRLKAKVCVLGAAGLVAVVSLRASLLTL